jgi:short-subunit dehydrogenase
MQARGSGQLVGRASVAGIRGLPGHAAYCASKAATISYCESLRGELRASGVQVITIAPGYIATPLTARNRYPMPFLMSAEAFAQLALRCIDRGVRYRVIPWPMGIVAKILKVLPDALFDRLLKGQPRKHRHKD